MISGDPATCQNPKDKKDSISIFDPSKWQDPITSSNGGRISVDGFKNSLETFSRSNSRKSSASSTNSVIPGTPNTEISISPRSSTEDREMRDWNTRKNDGVLRDMNDFQFPAETNVTNRNKKMSALERELPQLRTSGLSTYNPSNRDSISVSPKSRSDEYDNPIIDDLAYIEDSSQTTKRLVSDPKTQIDSAISITLTPLDEQGKSYKKPIYIKRPDEEPVSVPGILDDFWTLPTSAMISKMEKNLDRSKFNQINDLRDQLVHCGATQDEQRLVLLTTGSKNYTLKYTIDTSRTPSTWQSNPRPSYSPSPSPPMLGLHDQEGMYEFETPENELLFDISDSVFKVATGCKVDEGMTNHQLALMINRACFTEGGEINSRLKKIREKVELYDLASPYRDQEDHDYNVPFSHCYDTANSGTINVGGDNRDATKTSKLLDNATYCSELDSMDNHDHAHSHATESSKRSRIDSIIRRSKSLIKRHYREEGDDVDSRLEEFGATRALASTALNTALLMEDKVQDMKDKRLESNLGTCRELKLVIDSLRTPDPRLY